MKKLIAISIAFTSISLGGIPALAEIDPRIHKLCIDAKDYAGCVTAQKGLTSTTAKNSSDARAKTEELVNKLYEFNKRRYIERSPHLTDWVEKHPKAARPIIEKEFLFFTQEDNDILVKELKEDSGKVSELCLKRGASIDRQFDWKPACEHAQSYGDDFKAKNELFYGLILDQISMQEETLEKENNCRSSGKSIRMTRDGEACMSDYEYASYQQQEKSRAADYAYRQQQIEQAERDRKSAALNRLADTFREAGKAWSQPTSTQCFGSSTTYGSSTYGSATCY